MSCSLHSHSCLLFLINFYYNLNLLIKTSMTIDIFKVKDVTKLNIRLPINFSFQRRFARHKQYSPFVNLDL